MNRIEICMRPHSTRTGRADSPCYLPVRLRGTFVHRRDLGRALQLRLLILTGLHGGGLRDAMSLPARERQHLSEDPDS